MLANAAGIMPDSLKFEADQHFFERGLDGVDVVVHGRHSHERQPRSNLRRRLILTRQVPAIAAHPSNEKALFCNPSGASFEQALAVLGTPDGSVGVIGGTGVFWMFLDRYDVFHLARAPDVRLPGGRPVFLRCASPTLSDLLVNDVVERADQLSRRASNYITRHDLISSKVRDGDISEDTDRLHAAHEALAGFRFAVEHSRPNSRVRTLGLA